MEVLVNSYVFEKDESEIYQMFYNFYEKLNGKRIISKLRIINNIKASNSLNELNQNEEMKILKVMEEDKLLAFSRFRIGGNYDELLVSEIIPKDSLDKETKDEVYKRIIKYYEKYALYVNIPKIFLEIPWFDRDYQYWASEFSFQFPSDKELFYIKSTFLAEKERVNIVGEFSEWARSRRQTER